MSVDLTRILALMVALEFVITICSRMAGLAFWQTVLLATFCGAGFAIYSYLSAQ